MALETKPLLDRTPLYSRLGATDKNEENVATLVAILTSEGGGNKEAAISIPVLKKSWETTLVEEEG